MATTPRPFARAWLLAVAFLAILTLVIVLRDSFAPPHGSLKADLPVTATEGFRLEIENGRFFSGYARIRIEKELLSVERVFQQKNKQTGKVTLLPALKGEAVRKAPDTFIIKKRGLEGTAPAAHGEGTSVTTLDGALLPEANSTYAADVDWLFDLILWLTGIVFILTEAFLLYCTLAFKARPGERSHYSHGLPKLEMFWAVAMAVILFLLAFIQHGAWKEIKQQQPTAADNPVKVQVLVKQFKWFFRHAGIDGKFGTPDDVIAGTLKVPVGRKVAIQLRSMDVIHSFFLPNLRLKQDAVPGLNVPVWFKTMKTGTFPIMCAELCGLGHSTMASKLEVLPADEWEAWLESASKANRESIEEEELPRPEWQNDDWWWWDQNPVKVGWPGRASR